MNVLKGMGCLVAALGAVGAVEAEPDKGLVTENETTRYVISVPAGEDYTLTADDVAKAMGGSAAQRRYVVGYGEQDGCVWAILVRDRSVVVTCAPRGLYDDVDLRGYGDSLGVYLAYTLGTD